MLFVGLERPIAHVDAARLAVELEEDRAAAVGMRIADGQELDDQRLARLDLDGDFLARLLAVEEDGVGRMLTSEYVSWCAANSVNTLG